MFVLSLILFIHPVVANDIWFNLFFGEYIASGHGIPEVEKFVYTSIGNRWYPWEWFSSLLFHLIYKYFNITGLVIFPAFIFALSPSILYIWGRKELKISPFFLILFITLLIYILANFVTPRSYLFSVLFFTILFLMLWRMEKTRSKFYLPVMFFLFVAWVNLHPGVYLGLLSVVIYSIVKKNYKVFLVSIGGMLCNPMFIKYFYIPLDFIFERGYIREFTPMIHEYFPLYHVSLRVNSIFFLFFILLISTLVFVVFSKNSDSFDKIIVIVFAIAGWLSSRFVLFFGIAGIAAIINSLQYRKIKSKVPGYISIIIPLTLIVIAMTGGVYMRPSVKQKPSIGINESNIPVKGVNYLKDINFNGRIFNSYSYGGYLLFRGYSPFIDGRTDIYDEETLLEYRNIMEDGRNYREIMDKYEVDCFFLKRSKIGMNRMGISINSRLWRDKEWGLAYWNDGSLIYLKKEKFTGVNYYNYFNPDLFERSVFRQDADSLILKELRRKWEQDRNCYTVYYSLFLFHKSKGRMKLARHILNDGLKIENNTRFERAVLLNNLGATYLEEGKSEGIKYIKKALSIRKNEISNYYLGKYYLQKKRNILSWYHLRMALWQNPYFTPARNLLKRL